MLWLSFFAFVGCLITILFGVKAFNNRKKLLLEANELEKKLGIVELNGALKFDEYNRIISENKEYRRIDYYIEILKDSI